MAASRAAWGVRRPQARGIATRARPARCFENLWIPILATLLMLSVACSENRPPRVLLVGIDGASARVIDPLLEAGLLPNLSKISQQGVSGPIESAKPLVSPRIWNTISTGKTPAKHGIFNFTKDGENGEKLLMLSTDRKVHSLWNIASDAGLRVAVVNWWNTFPPEKVRGVIVSDHFVAKDVESRLNITGAVAEPGGVAVFPESWENRLLELVDDRTHPVPFENPFLPEALSGPLPEWAVASILTQWFEQDAALMRISLAVEAEEKPDLMMVLLPGIDRVSHSLWGVLEPAHLYPKRLRANSSERAAGAGALRAYYRYTDALVGKLIERFHRDDLVIVVSDHGFEGGVVFKRLTGKHKGDDALHGVLFARGAGIDPGSGVGEVSIRDITPTILAWLGLPIAQDMDGVVADFVAEAAVPRVATYDVTPIERMSVGPSGADDQILENLQALGYME